MSNYGYPQDEFDVDEDERVPVGVHRASVPAWRSWIPLLIILIVVPALAWGAVQLLNHSRSRPTGGSTSTPGGGASSVAATTAAAEAPTTAEAAEQPATPPAAEAPTTPPPSADLTTGITLYNGTSTNGLAGRTGSRLENSGYTGVTVPGGSYTQDNPSVTTVYYARPENAVTAQAVASLLGIGNVVESAEQAQSNAIVIILRSDFSE